MGKNQYQLPHSMDEVDMIISKSFQSKICLKVVLLVQSAIDIVVVFNTSWEKWKLYCSHGRHISLEAVIFLWYCYENRKIIATLGRFAAVNSKQRTWLWFWRCCFYQLSNSPCSRCKWCQDYVQDWSEQQNLFYWLCRYW